MFQSTKLERGANVSAAFTALQHESPSAVIDELLEQPRRRNVQVGCDACLFQLHRLIGTTTGNERKRRAAGIDDFQLLLSQCQGDEAQDAHAPGPVTERLAVSVKEIADFVCTHQGQRQERQRAVVGDFGGKRCGIAHTSHRALYQRIIRMMRTGERPSLV